MTTYPLHEGDDSGFDSLDDRERDRRGGWHRDTDDAACNAYEKRLGL